MVDTKLKKRGGEVLNYREKQLEEIADKINNYKPQKSVPLFEIFVTMFSILVAIMLFWWTDMLHVGLGDEGNFYWLLLSIMPQYMWAFTFFITGVLKGVGLLIDNISSRITGLVLSSILYTIFAISHFLNFPSIGAITFSCMAIFSVLSIPVVKITGLDNDKGFKN